MYTINVITAKANNIHIKMKINFMIHANAINFLLFTLVKGDSKTLYPSFLGLIVHFKMHQYLFSPLPSSNALIASFIHIWRVVAMTSSSSIFDKPSSDQTLFHTFFFIHSGDNFRP